MVAILPRMRKLNTLLNIKLGTGAAVLPAEVTRIHMDFALKISDGHWGPKKFWRTCLPRLKYHNPSVPMTINRTNDQQGPALLTVHFTSTANAADRRPAISSTTQASTSTAPVAASTTMAPTERTEVINMKHRTDDEIWEEVARVTKAKAVAPTAEEEELIQRLARQKIESDADSKRQHEVNAERKRQKAVLAAARGDALTSVT